MDYTTLTPEELFNEHASAGLIDEGSRRATVRTGHYALQVRGYEGQKDADGRKSARLRADVFDEKGARKGNIFFTVSWQTRRTKTGKLDRASRLWAQLCKALYPQESAASLESKPVADILNTAVKYPIRGFISEAFEVGQDPNGNAIWDEPRGEDASEKIADYRAKGYRAINTVQSLYPPQA
jgi:hypothetical protein